MGLQLFPLSAEQMHAAPLSGPGDYEFLFFTSEKKPEIEALTARFREFAPELEKLQNELKKTEDEIRNLGAQVPEKKSARLEWSPIEGVTGYNVKLYNSKKVLVDTQTADENTFSVDLAPGEYFFQVAAVTKYKTGTYSRMTPFRVSRGKPNAAQLGAEERAEGLREKIRIQKSIRGEYLKSLRASAAGTGSATDAKADLTAPGNAAVYIAMNKKVEPYAMSAVSTLPGRTVEAAAVARSVQNDSAFYWGAGLIAGVQDTKLDFFRIALGAEGFLRYDRAFFRFFYPQLKLQTMYSGGKTNVYDAMIYTNLYPGVYYPITIAGGFSLFVSVSTGANWFVVLSSAGSASIVQWGVMPGVELQYALGEKTSLYLGSGVNFTFDANGVLKFVPISLGVTRKF